MGTGAFFNARRYSKFGVKGSGIIGPGAFLFYLLFRIGIQIKYRMCEGQWLKRQNSRVVSNEGKIKYTIIMPIVVNVATNLGYFVVMTLAWFYAK